MTITLAQLISTLIGVVLPILVALVTDRIASGGVKAVTLLALAAVTSYLSAWLVALNGGAPFDWSQAAFGVLTTFTIAVAAHLGLWRSVGLTGIDGAAAKVGLDSSSRPVVGPVD